MEPLWVASPLAWGLASEPSRAFEADPPGDFWAVLAQCASLCPPCAASVGPPTPADVPLCSTSEGELPVQAPEDPSTGMLGGSPLAGVSPAGAFLLKAQSGADRLIVEAPASSEEASGGAELDRIEPVAVDISSEAAPSWPRTVELEAAATARQPHPQPTQQPETARELPWGAPPAYQGEPLLKTPPIPVSRTETWGLAPSEPMGLAPEPAKIRQEAPPALWPRRGVSPHEPVSSGGPIGFAEASEASTPPPAEPKRPTKGSTVPVSIVSAEPVGENRRAPAEASVLVRMLEPAMPAHSRTETKANAPVLPEGGLSAWGFLTIKEDWAAYSGPTLERGALAAEASSPVSLGPREPLTDAIAPPQAPDPPAFQQAGDVPVPQQTRREASRAAHEEHLRLEGSAPDATGAEAVLPEKPQPQGEPLSAAAEPAEPIRAPGLPALERTGEGRALAEVHGERHPEPTATNRLEQALRVAVVQARTLALSPPVRFEVRLPEWDAGLLVELQEHPDRLELQLSASDGRLHESLRHMLGGLREALEQRLGVRVEVNLQEGGGFYAGGGGQEARSGWERFFPPRMASAGRAPFVGPEPGPTGENEHRPRWWGYNSIEFLA